MPMYPPYRDFDEPNNYEQFIQSVLQHTEESQWKYVPERMVIRSEAVEDSLLRTHFHRNCLLSHLFGLYQDRMR